MICVYLNSKHHFGWDILHDEMGLKAAGGKLQGWASLVKVLEHAWVMMVVQDEASPHHFTAQVSLS